MGQGFVTLENQINLEDKKIPVLILEYFPNE